MSLINELRQAQQTFEAAQARLEALQKNPALQALQEFEEQLRGLMGKYGMSLKDVNILLDPDYRAPGAKKATASKQRHLRRFTNPHTGEVTESYGGVNKVMAEWREKYGWEEVQKWGVIVPE